jgi:hypothetical protein
MISRLLFLHEDTSLPMQLFFHSRFIVSDCGHVWMLINIKGYINQLCGKTPTDLRMRVLAPSTNFDGITVTLRHSARLRLMHPTNMDKTPVS